MFSTICSSFEFQLGHLTGNEPLVVKTTRTSQTNPFQHGFCRPLHFKQNPPPKIVSRVSKPTEAPPSSDHLINSSGLSPDLTHSLATRVKNSSNSVLALFRDYGFTQAQITHVVSRRPGVLVFDSERNLKPKLDFFRRLGVSGSELGDIIAMDPSILVISLENQILPSFYFLKNYVDSNADIIKAYKRYTYVFRYNSVMLMVYNIKVLQENGVPEVYISRLIISQPRTLMLGKDKFKEIVDRIKGMGFKPSTPMFVHAVRSMASLRKETLNRKMLLFHSFGWSDDELLDLFKKQPIVLTYSEKKLHKGLKYFLEEKKWPLEVIKTKPSLLYLSLEKRVIPRYAVLDILLSNGVKVNVSTIMTVSEDDFVAKYVSKYGETLPELLEIYKCGTGMETELAGLEIHSAVSEVR